MECAREGERKVDPLFPVPMDLSCPQQKRAGSKCGLREASHGLRGGSPGWVRRGSWVEEGGQKRRGEEASTTVRTGTKLGRSSGRVLSLL